MSFKSYACATLPDGSLQLRDPQPLILSGRHGLIARFVLGERFEGRARWTLTPDELQDLATLDARSGDRLIVFELPTDDGVEVLALDRITGVSVERTEMMLAFHPLELLSHGPVLVVRRADAQRTYVEELCLEGGALAPSASWHWRKPHLALGGVMCGR